MIKLVFSAFTLIAIGFINGVTHDYLFTVFFVMHILLFEACQEVWMKSMHLRRGRCCICLESGEFILITGCCVKHEGYCINCYSLINNCPFCRKRL